MSETEEFFLWPPHQAFYIHSMLFNTARRSDEPKALSDV